MILLNYGIQCFKVMKFNKRIALFSAISLFLVGCDTTTIESTPKLYAASLLTDCLNQSSLELFNNSTQSYSDPKIQMTHPKVDDLTHIGKTIKSYLSQETEKVETYKEILDTKPNFGVFRVSMKNTNSPISCDYVYLTDKKQSLIQKPLLFKLQSGSETKYINAEHVVNPTSPIEYLFELPMQNQGVRLFNLEYLDSDKSKPVPNEKVIKRVYDVVYSNNLLDFYDLGTPINPQLAIDLANHVTASVELPRFIPTNPISIALPPHKRLAAEQTDKKTRTEMMLDRFNQSRYVDANLGIDNTVGVLDELKREFGIISSSDGEPPLNIKTDVYSQQELSESRRFEQMQQQKQGRY